MSVTYVQMRFFFSNELYLSAAEVNHNTTIEKAMGFLIKAFCVAVATFINFQKNLGGKQSNAYA